MITFRVIRKKKNRDNVYDIESIISFPPIVYLPLNLKKHFIYIDVPNVAYYCVSIAEK